MGSATKSKDVKLVRTLARLRLQVVAGRKVKPRSDARKALSHEESRVAGVTNLFGCFDVSTFFPLLEQNSKVLFQHCVGEGSEVRPVEARFYFVFDAVNLFLVPHPCALVEALVLLCGLGFPVHQQLVN